MNCALEAGGRGVAGDCGGLRAEVWDAEAERESREGQSEGEGEEEVGRGQLGPTATESRERGRPPME